MNAPEGQEPGQPPQMARHIIGDPMNPGVPVGQFDHPAGWRAESQLHWNTANVSNPALLFARAFNPNGPEAWEMLPHQDFYTTAFGAMSDPLAAFGRMAMNWFGGSSSGGQPAPAAAPAGFSAPGPRHAMIGGLAYGPEVHAPMRPADALVQFVLPRFRGRIPGLRIVGVKPMPQLAEMLNIRDVAAVPHDGATARIAYDLAGHPIEEELLCGVYVMPGNGGGQQNWGLKPLMSFRAAAGRLDDLLQHLLWIPRSVQLNPQWQAIVSNMQAQINAGQHYAQMAQNQETLAVQARTRQMQSDYFNWHQETQAGLQAQSWQSFNNRVEGFGDAMMGRTAYADPSRTEQPHYDYGYNPHVWTDGQGNWHHSQDPNFDPNIGADRTWTRAEPPAGR